jgi:transcriptional regulator with XRE-family HTH domain
MGPTLSELDLRKRLAANLRTLRGAQGLSQESLADAAGIHRTFVSQVERELKNVSLDSIRKLANALGVDPVELFQPLATDVSVIR